MPALRSLFELSVRMVSFAAGRCSFFIVLVVTGYSIRPRPESLGHEAKIAIIVFFVHDLAFAFDLGEEVNKLIFE